MMFDLFPGLAALAFSLMLTPILIKTLWSWNVIDMPDDRRKLHSVPVTRGGGLPILLSILLAFGVFVGVSVSRDAGIPPEAVLFARLLPGIAVIFATGMIDDCVGLGPGWKLLGQTVSALLVWLMGLRITAPGGHHLGGVLSLTLTVTWVVGCANMSNLMDGIDGLAAGMALIAAVTATAVGLVQGNASLVLTGILLSGALLGFLFYNSHPARIFLGDSGSLLIGFTLACCGILWSRNASNFGGAMAPVMLLIVPICDLALTIARRFLRQKPLFVADRGHIHHRLLASNLTPRQIVMVLYALCTCAAVFAFLGEVFQRTASERVASAFFISFAIVLYFGRQRLGYVEIQLAAKLLLRGQFSRMMLSNLFCIYELEQTIAKQHSVHACWSAIRKSCRALGFDSVALNATGTTYRDVFRSETDDCCFIVISLPDNASLQLGLSPGADVPARCMLPLARVLRAGMRMDHFQELSSKAVQEA